MHNVKSLSSPLGHFVHVVDTHQDDRDNTDDDNYDYMAVKANFRMPLFSAVLRSSPDLNGTDRGKVFARAGQPHAVHGIVIKNERNWGAKHAAANATERTGSESW